MNNSPIVLIVDDEIDLVRILSLNLTMLGFNCVASGNAEEAILYIKNHKVDLIVCDVVMPGMSGIELFWYLKNLMDKLPPFLFYSGLIEFPLKEPFPEGVLGFLQKPFVISALLKKLPEQLMTTEALMEG